MYDSMAYYLHQALAEMRDTKAAIEIMEHLVAWLARSLRLLRLARLARFARLLSLLGLLGL